MLFPSFPAGSLSELFFSTRLSLRSFTFGPYFCDRFSPVSLLAPVAFPYRFFFRRLFSPFLFLRLPFHWIGTFNPESVGPGRSPPLPSRMPECVCKASPCFLVPPAFFLRTGVSGSPPTLDWRFVALASPFFPTWSTLPPAPLPLFFVKDHYWNRPSSFSLFLPPVFLVSGSSPFFLAL